MTAVRSQPESACPRCGRPAGELHHSTLVGGVCCERCYCRAAPPASREARAYKPPAPPRPPKPTGRQRLHDRVYAALERASVAVTGGKQAIGGGGGRLTGYCPACHRGLLTVEVIAGDPPRVRQNGCGDGCPPNQVARALR